MKTWRTPHALLIACAALGLRGCGNEPLMSGVELASGVRGLLTAALDGTETAHDIWRDGNRRLTLTSPDAVESLRLKHKYLVMVSFSEGSRLSPLLRADRATLAYFPTTPDADGAALLGLDDTTSIDHLAAAAHAGSKHACGRLQVLDLNAVQAVDGLTPPLFDEAVALTAVKELVEQPNAARIEASIQTLEDLGTRHHTTTSGLEAPNKVKELFTAAAGSGLPQLVIEEFDHTAAAAPSQQKSIIARLPGTSDDTTTIVIGAHLDSINGDGEGEPAPGADDDASGVATMVEVVKALADSGARFARRVEFHAYAAEEVGLRGSSHIAQTYREGGRNVSAMLQLDMNAWNADAASQTIFLVTRDTNVTLRRSLKDLLNVYLGGDYIEKWLDGGTSDHKAWHVRGFPAVFPFEDPDNYNERLHTTGDTSEVATNTALSARFAKLVLAFLAHHAGLQGVEADAAAQKTAWRAATPKDLRLALAPGDFGDTYAVTVATSTDVAGVEVCVIQAAGGTGCTTDRIPATLARTTEGRAFFTVDNDVPLAAGSRLAVFGYDAAERLVMQRSVRVEAK